MSKYTTEVRYICEHYAGLNESTGFEDVDEIVETIRKVVKKVRSISAVRIYKNKVEL